MTDNSPESPPRLKRGLPKYVGPVYLVLLLLIFSPIVLIYILVVEVPLRLQFLWAVLSQKKSILFVYSDSPIWKSYLEDHVLPKISDQAIVLKWSERNHWRKLDWNVRAFHHWGGNRDFNPLAIVFCNFFKVRTIRFHRPFLDYKHGKEQSLHQAESKLYELVGRK